MLLILLVLFGAVFTGLRLLLAVGGGLLTLGAVVCLVGFAVSLLVTVKLTREGRFSQSRRDALAAGENGAAKAFALRVSQFLLIALTALLAGGALVLAAAAGFFW